MFHWRIAFLVSSVQRDEIRRVRRAFIFTEEFTAVVSNPIWSQHFCVCGRLVIMVSAGVCFDEKQNYMSCLTKPNWMLNTVAGTFEDCRICSAFGFMNQDCAFIIPRTIENMARRITAGTLVPAVLMATSHSYGNGQTLTTHRIQTP